jgi:glycosyltransferase involved in cell wall biosynthesis
MTDDERAAAVARAFLSGPGRRAGMPDEATLTAALRRSMEAARPPPGPATPRDPRLLIRGHLYRYGSYGLIAEHLGRQLERLGVEVAYFPIVRDEAYFRLPDFVLSRIVADPSPFDKELLIEIPPGEAYRGRRTVWLSMWEVDRLPPGAAGRFNQVARVAVPCRWNAQVWADSGVRPDLIRVVPLGVDPGAGFVADTPPPADRFVVGMAGRLGHGGLRKNIVAGREAWDEALGDTEDAWLHVKVFQDEINTHMAGWADHPRVVVDARPMLGSTMAEWTKGLSVLLVPSRGEGFGLHTAEALACGRPVVAAYATGTADLVDDSCGWPLDYAWEPAGEAIEGGSVFAFYRAGRWAVPTKASMVARLREAYDCWKARDGRYEARCEAAAARGAGFTWEASARKLLVVLNEAGIVEGRVVAAASAPLVPLIDACPDRGEAAACCGGVIGVCRAGRGRPGTGYVTTIECARCALAGYLEPPIIPSIIPGVLPTWKR